ncbi:hypothetical protein [Serinicoccus sp. CUA-874]|uniref:hypothetical protein n=1 Tax=Serinicoccus sp. CUA-874 TaxID=1517939 RepID=UPI00192D18F1|nr:hypothetical protein [Serinicoccus sp. CUA-874]
MTTSPRRAVATIVVAMLLGSSVWFSANSAADGLRVEWGLDAGGVGRLTLAVQLGFAVGTIAMAMTSLADRFRASRVFAVSAVVAAAANAASRCSPPASPRGCSGVSSPGPRWPGSTRSG